MFYRSDLTVQEVLEFVKWAHENYKPFEPILGIWHPIVQSTCVEINKKEAGYPAIDAGVISGRYPSGR